MSSQISLKSPNVVSVACLLCLAMLLASSGCSTFNLSLAKAPVVPSEKTTGESRGLYQVEMSGGFSKGSVFQGQIDGPITVQTALERSGATEKYRSMDIMVYRVVKESGQGLKLPVEFDRQKKSVAPEHDYAIHPNDRIIVRSSSTNPLDKLVDSFGLDK